jgi:hypothetical protein
MRAAGAILLALVLLPAYRLLDTPDAGAFPRGSLAAADLSRTLLLVGTFIEIAVGVVISRLLDPAAIERATARAGEKLTGIPILWFAAGLGVITTVLTLVFSLVVLEGKPNLIDSMVQLTHARFIAAGQLSGPADEFLEFWHLPNSLVTENGWVSQYPPGYLIFLAAGLRLGIVQVIGPLFAGLTVFFTALAGERLLRDDRATARVGAIMLCLSPFLIGLAGAFMNHVGAAAFASAAIYFGVRSRDDDSLAWAAAAGAAVGVVFSIRPLSGMVVALVVAVVWVAKASSAPASSVARFLQRTVAALAGIAPILALVGAYNQHFFGSPLRFGYVASQGPLVGPGFHRDPTGAMYGPVQALAYTSSDLVTFSLYLLETPLPAVLIAGLFLVLANRFGGGVPIIAFWALLPLVANALYWHHGMFMGPRMLNEFAAPWTLLLAVAAVGLVRLIPTDTLWGNYSPRAALTLTLALSWIAGIVYLGPQRLASYGGGWMQSSRIVVAPDPRPSLVFVHGAWTGRVASRLLARGMRLDSLEASLRQNTTCDSDRYARWYSSDAAQRGPAPPLDFSIVPRDPPPLMRIAEEDEIRVRPGVQLTPECLREVASDTLGIVDVGPLLWQGDLPGLEAKGRMFVRDMGPEANARLIRKYPDRVPLMLLRLRDDQPPTLVPYQDGIKALWPGSAASG